MVKPDVQDIACPHTALSASVDITGLLNEADDPEGFTAAVKVWCIDCDEPFVWMGVSPGLSPTLPMCDVSSTVLNAPCKPRDSVEGFGEGLPGFQVRERIGRPTLKDQTAMQMRAAAAITNPSKITPRMFAESAEQWAARAVIKVLELKDVD